MPNESSLLQEIDVILENALLYIFILVIVTFGILFIASRLLREDVEPSRFALSTGALFATSFVVYLGVNIFFHNIMNSVDAFTLNENSFVLRVAMFLGYFIFLLVPSMFILKTVYMFFKQRLLISVIFSTIVSLLFILAV